MMIDPIAIIVIVALILLNGLFVAAEFAIIAIPKASIQRLASEGGAVARWVASIVGDPVLQDRYIATAQLGITSASLGLGMYGEHQLAEWLAHWLDGIGLPSWLAAHAVATLVAVAILTYLHIVVGEMVPKALGLQYPQRTAAAITPFMRSFQFLFYPFVLALNGIGNLLLKLIGIERRAGHGDHLYSPEELKFIVRESEEGGLLDPEAAEILDELFEFSDLTAGEVMAPRVRVHGISVDATPDEIREVMAEATHTRYPVYEEDLDHIIGVVHVRDLLRKISVGESVTRADVRHVPFLPETSRLDTVLSAIRRHQSQMVVVMDEHGGTAGIVTTSDLFREVVGSFEDGAIESQEIFHDDDGRLHAAGTARLEEVGEWLEQELEHEDVDSVSGLVLSLLDRPPRIGDSVRYEGIEFTVIAIEGHGVAECLVAPTDEEEEGPDDHGGDPDRV